MNLGETLLYSTCGRSKNAHSTIQIRGDFHLPFFFSLLLPYPEPLYLCLPLHTFHYKHIIDSPTQPSARSIPLHVGFGLGKALFQDVPPRHLFRTSALQKAFNLTGANTVQKESNPIPKGGPVGYLERDNPPELTQ